MSGIVYAEDVNYWRTGKSSPDSWMEKAAREIETAGGKVTGEAFGRDGEGRAAYMLAFEFPPDRFKVVWPVLPSKSGDASSAKRQAATMLFHDVKARCVSAKVLGPRSAFFSYVQLEDGRVAAQVASPDAVVRILPRLLVGGEEA
jgi:hypothetical protein